MTADDVVVRQLNVVRGINAVTLKPSNEDQGLVAINEAKKLKLIKSGDKIVTIISTDEGEKTEQNVMKIAIVQ